MPQLPVNCSWSLWAGWPDVLVWMCSVKAGNYFCIMNSVLLCHVTQYHTQHMQEEVKESEPGADPQQDGWITSQKFNTNINCQWLRLPEKQELELCICLENQTSGRGSRDKEKGKLNMASSHCYWYCIYVTYLSILSQIPLKSIISELPVYSVLILYFIIVIGSVRCVIFYYFFY